MPNLVSDSLSSIKPGDILFYTSPHKENRLFTFGQSLSRSISSLGAQLTHAAIVTEVAENQIQISHSYATTIGGHLSDRTLKDLSSYKKVVVVSPCLPNSNDEFEHRDAIVQVAKNFGAILLDRENNQQVCPALGCSNYRMMVRPILDRKNLKPSTRKLKIAKSLVDFMMGNPRIEKFDQQGNPVRKPTFCAEFVHCILQTAAFYQQLSPENKNCLQALCETPIPFDRELREACIQGIYERFDEFFPDEGKEERAIVMQNSTSFAPGRLLTEFEKRGHQITVLNLPSE